MTTITLPEPVSIAAKVTFTAKEDAEPGTVQALVSAYGLKYRIGYATWHTIEANAFADSIASQASIPLFWQHSWQGTEQAPIGHGTASEPDDGRGMLIDGKLYVDLDPSIARIYEAMRAGALTEWSIGYQVEEIRVDADDDMHEYVTRATLLEASSVLRGANPATETLRVATQVLGRPPTAEEAAMLASGKSLTQPDHAPAQDPTPVTSSLSWDDLPVMRKLYGHARS